MDSRERFQECPEDGCARSGSSPAGVTSAGPRNFEQTAPRGRLGEIQGMTSWSPRWFPSGDHSPLYRRLLGAGEAAARRFTKSLDDLHKLPLVTREAFVASQKASLPWGDYSPIRQQIWTRTGWLLFDDGRDDGRAPPFPR